MKKTTIIFPVHVYMEDYIKNALLSVNDLDADRDDITLLIIGRGEVCGNVKRCADSIGMKFPIEMYFNEEDDFVNQINLAVQACKTPYFSILEFDDVYMPYYFKTMEDYLKEKEDVSLFLSINDFYDEDGKFMCFGNEIAWDVSFADNLGYVGTDELNTFADFNCTGGLFKTEDFISMGGLKKSMKALMWYEFLKRYAVNGKKIFVVPQVCYCHTMKRQDSYMMTIGKNMEKEEVEFLYNAIAEECKSTVDTNKEYKKEE